MLTWTIGRGTLGLLTGDITTMDVDAVVNAANSRLAGGGGVDGAIHRAAGAEALQAACRKIIAEQGELPAGKAVITPGFALPADHIIHTVGPFWSGGNTGEAEALASAYTESMRLARSHGLARIAFPAISCGAYGYPVDRAARVALTALMRGLETELVAEAYMVLAGEAAFLDWKDAAAELLD